MTDAADTRPAIAAAIVVAGGRVLMIRRRVVEGELSWQFPAGKVEPGESDEGAAVRETAEETGVIVRAVRHLGRRIHPATGRVMIYIACEAVRGTASVADPAAVAEVEWCDRAALAERVPLPFFAPVAEYLAASLA
jgi:8-oxo-dGTP pyrophosphatase MutT (NUDIX family)